METDPSDTILLSFDKTIVQQRPQHHQQLITRRLALLDQPPTQAPPQMAQMTHPRLEAHEEQVVAAIVLLFRKQQVPVTCAHFGGHLRMKEALAGLMVVDP